MSVSAPFRAFFTAAVLTNVGDGVRLAGGPLLVAAVTADPLLVGTAVFVQQAPWLLLSPVAGVWADRVDRARLLALVTLLRAVLAAAIVALVLTGALGIAPLLIALLVAGSLEVLADTSSSALLVELVPSDHLDRANARLYVVFVLGNQLAGPAAGAVLFALGPAWPFAVDAAVLATSAGVLVVLAHRRGAGDAARHSGDRPRFRADLAEGARAIARNAPVRLLALLLAVMNVTFSAAFASWVLYAGASLGVPTAAFGVLITCSAIGGLLGALLAAPLLRRLGAVVLVRAGLILEAGVLLVLGLTRSPIVAGATMLVFGCHAAVWGIVATTIRQRSVPIELQGRVVSFIAVLTMGGSAVGALLGGALAGATTLATPFLTGAAVDLVLIAVTWRLIGRCFARSPEPGAEHPDAAA
jgi:MFS family permease